MNRFPVVLLMVLGSFAFGQNVTPPASDPAAQSETQKWLATMDAQWQPIFAREVTAPFDAEIANLRQQYLASLDANMAKATRTGNLDLTLLWRKERDRFLAAKDIPATDDAGDPAELKAARAVFRSLGARMEKDRLGRARSAQARYDQVLAQAQVQLTQRQRIEDALAVKTKREEIAKAWLGDTGGSSVAKPENHDVGDKSTAAVSGELAIISATYGEVSGHRSADITGHIKKVFQSGQPTLKLNTRFGADGKDPAPAVLKQTTITYSIGGQTKKKTFPESYDLKFKEDLN
ncbi:MAG: hypothetical protein P4L99_04435 [Chthoniobacter sp.]|nr:hypothetical protein [Chthoniobacter sp.]